MVLAHTLLGSNRCRNVRACIVMMRTKPAKSSSALPPGAAPLPLDLAIVSSSRCDASTCSALADSVPGRSAALASASSLASSDPPESLSIQLKSCESRRRLGWKLSGRVGQTVACSAPTRILASSVPLPALLLRACGTCGTRLLQFLQPPLVVGDSHVLLRLLGLLFFQLVALQQRGRVVDRLQRLH